MLSLIITAAMNISLASYNPEVIGIEDAGVTVSDTYTDSNDSSQMCEYETSWYQNIFNVIIREVKFFNENIEQSEPIVYKYSCQVQPSCKNDSVICNTLAKCTREVEESTSL